MSLLSNVPKYITELIPYPPGKPVEEVEREYGISGSVKLASNENPLGPSPKAVESVKNALSSINIYPDGSGFYLKRKLAEKLEVAPENIVLGNGSNEIIELLVRAFLTKDDEAVMGDPAFIVYQLITKAVGARPVPVPLENFAHDLPSMAKAVTKKTKIVFVANPNNPTGTIVSREEMEAFFNSIPDDVLIVMDEAYHEYASSFSDYQESTCYLTNKPNLVVLRTFSKAYGLAGLRVGYGIASEEVVSMLERVRQPFNINSLALAGAEAALDDISHIDDTIRVNSEGMKLLYGSLNNTGYKVVTSFANFLLFDTGMDGARLSEELLKRGVIVRSMAAYGLKTHLRVTVGMPQENDRFLKALSECI